MQSAVKLNISSDLEFSGQADSALEQLLLQTIKEHADQVAYMLQAYHAREKVSRVTVFPGSFSSKLKLITVQLQYTLEEFSACSAIDTLAQEKMTVTVHLDEKSTALELIGEYWPERDSD